MGVPLLPRMAHGNFVLEHNGVRPEAAASLAYWEDIVNILSVSNNDTNGRVNFDIPGIGNIYAQLPPPEIKRAAAVQSNEFGKPQTVIDIDFTKEGEPTTKDINLIFLA